MLLLCMLGLTSRGCGGRWLLLRSMAIILAGSCFKGKGNLLQGTRNLKSSKNLRGTKIVRYVTRLTGFVFSGVSGADYGTEWEERRRGVGYLDRNVLITDGCVDSSGQL